MQSVICFGIFPPASDLALLCIKKRARGKDRCVRASGGLLGKLAHTYASFDSVRVFEYPLMWWRCGMYFFFVMGFF